MIKSMTGYGRAEKTFEKYKITVEIKSVNNRYLDSNIRMYKQYLFVEDTVRECIASRISRGKVDVFIQYDTVGEDDRVISINDSVARGYIDALRSISEKYGVADDLSLSALASFPDIFSVEKAEQDKEAVIAHTREVVMSAIDDITENRIREGARLAEFFKDEISVLRELAEQISIRSPLTADEYRQRIRERIQEFLEDATVDESRLLTEVAVYADKVNITEELVRFSSHLSEYENLLKSDVPVGRKLDFTIQELNREANTMGSKCNDFEIGKAVVSLKAEIEKMREQVQNIE